MIGLLNHLLLKLKLATTFRNKIQVGENVFIHKNPTFIVRSDGVDNGIFIHDGVYIGRNVTSTLRRKL